jgi:hypothetical protein
MHDALLGGSAAVAFAPLAVALLLRPGQRAGR